MILALLLALQVTPDAPMPKGTGLPPPESEEGQVMAPVTTLLAALGREDGAGVLAVTRPEGGATALVDRGDGTKRFVHMTWPEFAAKLKPGADPFEERIATPAIEIDGDIAMVWAPYTARENGKAIHCGYDHFDLVREAAQWKVLSVTWSQRTTGCEAQ